MRPGPKNKEKINLKLVNLKTADEYGFAHPAVSHPQRVVWIPRDTLGMFEEEVRACQNAGVDVSTKGAEMDENGRVSVRGVPPGDTV